MLSERAQRQVDRFLDVAEEAMSRFDWSTVRENALAVLRIDPSNADALTFLAAAERDQQQPSSSIPTLGAESATAAPTSFCDRRYQVKRFLGEGGKKRVYLAHDTLLDREVAFALIKTEGLDEVGRERVRREAQAMGRLGAHAHLVSVFDLGETEGQPFIVTELMSGGDVENLLETAPDHRLPAERAVAIADAVCRGLEFAHSHAIVHRDLKPSNVWLATDGTPKIGDFGLAVATDRARLTQPGLMVGTVAYMPPEQAMGAEVSARSDLYSLGAMLYEMVTGRPPFVGDESVAIITQHLNVPPVAPSWHVPDLPPGLEALILRLLEKDPAKRPVSAAEVGSMLAGVLALTPRPPLPTLGEGETSLAAAPGPQSPLYRPIFVGREHELRHLQAAFDAAVSGQGALLTVVGEPGIGKTALCEQLATYAVVRGGRTLVGHCYEEGSLSLPYLAFVEGLRSYVLARDPDGLRKDLGSGAGEVARIVSDIRERLSLSPGPSPNVGGGVGAQTPVHSSDPEEERWRLFQAVTGFLRNAAAVQPLLIVLEDLHWADRGTLDLLMHLARNLQGARVLVVATYRDVEVDRSHPLSAALAELRRIGSFGRVLLRGLSAAEVQRMMGGITAQEVRWAFAEAVHRQTEGNPLFVQEVLRYLVEEGLIVHEGGRWQRAGSTPPEMAIPEGLRDVIGKRLSRLSAACNRVLAVAAVIGRDFALDTLRLLEAAPSEEELIAALEEADRVGVLEDLSRGGNVRFRFAHAFFRQTLYEEIFTPRRLRLHQEVARALERQYAARLDEHAAELAEHFAQSSDPADLAKAVRYGELAARRAVAVYAYGEAVHHLEEALLAQEVLDPADRAKRCALLLALCEAQMPLGDPRRVADALAPEAFELAEALDDRAQASRACRLALESLHRDSSANTQTPEWRQWAERADRYAAPGTAARAHADVALARVAMAVGEWDRGLGLLRRALELSRGLDDADLLLTCAWQLMRAVFTPRHWREAARLAEELADTPRAGASVRTIGQFLEFVGLAHASVGDRERAEAAWHELTELARRAGDAVVQINALRWEAILTVMDGRLDEAISLGHRVADRAEELGMSRLGAAWGLGVCVEPLLHLGRLDELRQLKPAIVGSGMSEGWDAAVLAHLGEHAESQASIDRWLARLDTTADAALSAELGPMLGLLRAAVLLGNADTVRRLADWLTDTPPGVAPRGAVTWQIRHRAAAAALLGDREHAEALYREGLESAVRMRFRPEVALIRLQLAELLLDEGKVPTPTPPPTLRERLDDGGSPLPKLGEGQGVRAEALAHLDFAIEEFRAMKMQPSLERALRHKGLLHA